MDELDELETTELARRYNETIEYRAKMYPIVIPAFLVVCSFAVIANAMVIWALRGTKVRNATVTLILSLTVSDIYASSICVCSLLYNSYLPIVWGTEFNPCIALALELMRTAVLITGTIQLLLIAAHHYISIVRPHSNKKFLQQMALFLSITAWILPLLSLLIMAFSVEDQGFHNCTQVAFFFSRTYRLSVSALLLIIFLLIIYCYSRLLCILRTNSARWRTKSAQSRMTRENKTLWTAILICTSFFIGWAPATIHFALTCSTCDLLRKQSFHALFFFSCIQLTFILGKSVLNPVIYSLRIPEVDAQIRQSAASCGLFIRGLLRLKWKNDDLVQRSSSKKAGAHRLAPEQRLLEQISWNGECGPSSSAIMAHDLSPPSSHRVCSFSEPAHL